MIRCSHLLIGLLLAAAAGALPAQPTGPYYDDSMQVLLRHTLSDSGRTRLLLWMANYWDIYGDTRRARRYLDEARRIDCKSPTMKGLYYWAEGAHCFPFDPECGLNYMTKADNIMRQLKTRVAYGTRASAWLYHATSMLRKGDRLSYVDLMINKAIPLALQAKDTLSVASYYKQLGTVFMNTGQLDKAETYLRSSIALLNQIGTHNYEKLPVYSWLGETYLLRGRIPETRVVMDTLKTLLADLPFPFVATGYHKLRGLYFQHQEQYEHALNSFDEGLRLMEQDSSDYDEFAYLKIKALVAAGRSTEAQPLLRELSSRNRDRTFRPEIRLPLYEAHAVINAGLHKDREAYEYMRKYAVLADSVHRSQLVIDVNALEIKYRNAESLKEIATLKARNEQIALRDRNSRLLSWLLTLTSLLLFVVALLSLLYYRNNRKLMRQKELNYRQQLKEIAQRQQLQFGQAVLQGEEQERRRVARDLHDGLGGILAGVKINLSGQVEAIPNGKRTEWTRIMGQLDHSVTELRRIAHNMMPVNLLKFGLRVALKDLCESLITPATSIDFQALGIEDNLSEETQIHIYRIVQELLSNAVKHAEAGHIILQCSQDNNTFLITQEDDGKGFDPTVTPLGMGLSNIRNRVGFLKGRIEIDSAINEGTIINIELYVGA